MLDDLDERRPPARRRGATWLAVRITVSVGLLAVLWSQFPDVRARDLVPTWTVGNVVLLAGAAALFLASYLLGAIRWFHMLRVLGLRSDRSRIRRHAFAGQFVSVVLPSSVGGDVLRVRRLAAEEGRGSTVFASVVLERLTGWLVLPVLTIVGLALNGGLRHLPRASALALAVALLSLGALGALLFAAGHRGVGRHCSDRAGWWWATVWAVHLGVDNLRRAPREGLEVFLAGFLLTLCQVGAVFLAARVLGIEQVGPTALLAFIPAVSMLQVLPIAIGGLGVREGALALFLAPLGVAAHEAVALGLLLYALTIATSLTGAPAFALGSRPEPTAHHRAGTKLLA